MAKNKVVTGVLTNARRGNLSVNGNPSWYVTIDETEYRTQTDSMVSYGVSNFKTGSKVRVEMTPANRIFKMEQVG